MGSSGYVHLEDVEVIRVTEKAILLRHADWDEDVWVPLSQVADADDYEAGDVGCTVSVTEWAAREKGIMPP